MKNKIKATHILVATFFVVILGACSTQNVHAATNTCACYTYNPNPVDGMLAYVPYSQATASSDSNCQTACKNSTPTTVNYYIYGDGSNYTLIPGREVTATQTTPLVATAPTHFNYTLLEGLPGFFTAGSTLNDLPTLILAIYKFGIWTVGIAGFFMLVVGGFMYMTSAGNTSSAGNARGIIWDSLLGIVAALGAYLLLYVINPELTKIKIGFTTTDITEATQGTPMGPKGKCQPCSTGSCSVSSLTAVFGDKATQASSICHGESVCISQSSTTDICSDGKSFAIGLFQINMIDSATSIGCNTKGEIFDTGTSKGTCVDPVGWKASMGGYCKRWSCKVKDLAAYNACVTKLLDPATNISVARSLSNNGTSWGRWGANKNSGCNFPK